MATPPQNPAVTTRRAGLQSDVEHVRHHEGEKDRTSLGLHLRYFGLQWFGTKRWRVHAPVQGGEHEGDDRESAKEESKVVGIEGDDDERTDDRPDAVAGVTDTESMRAALQRGASEQGIKSDVESAKSETNEKDAHQEQNPRVRERRAGRAEHDRHQRKSEDHSALQSLEPQPAWKDAQCRSDEVDTERRTGTGQREMEPVREAHEEWSEQ